MAIQLEREEEPSGTRKGESAATAAPEPEPPSPPTTTTSDGEREAAEAAPSQTIATDAFPEAAAATGIVASLDAAAGCDICRE